MPQPDGQSSADSARASMHRHDQEAKEQQAKSKKSAEETDTFTKTLLKASAGAGGFALSIATLPWMLHRFGEGLIESRRELAQFSGNLSAAFANFDVRQFFLQMKTARETEGSTTELVSAISEFNQAFQPLESQFKTLANLASWSFMKTGTALVVAIEGVLKRFHLDDIVKQLEAISRENQKHNRANRTNTAELLKQIYSNTPNRNHMGLPPLL
jgi:hypothetical protein